MFYLMKRVLSLSMMLSLLYVPFVQADSAADLKEVHSFQLTEKRLDQFTQAMRNMAKAAEEHPELAEKEDTLGDDASIDDMVAEFNKIPVLKKSVEDTGMSSREFVLFQMALLSAAMGHYVVEQGQKLPAEISAEHVKFYKAHEAQFEALRKEWDAMDAKAKAKQDQAEAEEDSEE